MGIAQASSLQAVLDDPAIDAVELATPNSQHCTQIQTAAQAGKHVFVEFEAFARCVQDAQPYPVSRDDVLHGV